MTRAINPQLVTRATGSVEALLELLFDGLDWPRPAHLEVEDVPLIDLRPADLHLREDAIARLSSVKQLPPLTAQQPFGVFILTFEGDRLPIGAIRRVVDGVVRRKRTRGPAGSAVWDLDDLMFFCRTGDGGGSVHVVAFREQDGKRTLRAISWSTDLPPQKLELLTQQTLPALIWPEDGGLDLDTWRAGWRDAFRTSYRQGVRSAEALAQIMADTACEVRDGIDELIRLETHDGPLQRVFTQVRTNLRDDLDEASFADMYAQTMVYGLLTARITHPEDFSGATTRLTFENPFLDALYTAFRGEAGETVDIDEFGLLDLAELLGRTDVDAILAEFGARDPRNDPVIYFYEEFLERYDPNKRRELGTYYTPVPIVRWIVDAVDHILRDQLSFPDGIADDTTWEDYTARTGIAVPESVDPTAPVIRALDPATGTGTFLLEWLRQSVGHAKGTERERRLREGLARVDAFEIDLPGYTVAHLKASLELPRELRTKVTPSIVLTDTLAGKRALVLRENDVIAEEGARAEHLKFSQHHNVIIGNPPYRMVSQDAGGGMITEVVEGRRLFDDVFETAAANTIFSHITHLYNLYVYFWRWSTWKVFEQVDTGPAVIGFITASSWLNGPGFMGLREHLRQHADDIYVLDLGGDNRGTEPDPNVFPIQSPVAITLAVRRANSKKNEAARIHYARVRGTRDEKLAALDGVPFAAIDWTVVAADWLDGLIPPTGSAEWQSYPPLADLLPWQQPGAKLNRTWPIAPHSNILEARWQRFLSTDDAEDRAHCFSTSATGRNIHTQVGALPRLVDEPIGTTPRPIVRYAYRSFDRQWTFEDPRLAKTESPALWAARGSRQLFLVSKMTRQMSVGPAAVVATAVPDLDSFRGAEGGKDVVPLYRDADGTPNADPRVLQAISAVHQRQHGAAPAVTVERLFAYIYGVLSGTDYVTRFADELATPGPRVPITSDPALFDMIEAHGRRLIWLDTFGERFTTEFGTIEVPPHIVWNPAPVIGPETPSEIMFDPAAGTIKVGDGLLSGVTREVYEYNVSGLKVLPKWLGYRTHRGSGRAASSANPLDQIRHTSWQPEWSGELAELVAVLVEHLRMQATGTQLLDQVLAGPLIPASELPAVAAKWRAVPKVSAPVSGGLFDLAAEEA